MVLVIALSVLSEKIIIEREFTNSRKWMPTMLQHGAKEVQQISTTVKCSAKLTTAPKEINSNFGTTFGTKKKNNPSGRRW